MLMEVSGYSVELVAERSRLSAKTIGNMRSGRHATDLDNLDAVAKVFGLNYWHMIMPNLDRDLLKSPSISRLVETYIGLKRAGRENIDRVAELEARYEKGNGT